MPWPSEWPFGCIGSIWPWEARRGEALASESLEAEEHHLGPLLESFLTPRMSGLTYQEVVDQVLTENCRAVTSLYATSKSVALANGRRSRGLLKHTGNSIRQTRLPGRASRKKSIRGVRASRRSKSVYCIMRLNSSRSHQRAAPPEKTVRPTMVHSPRQLRPL